MTRGYKFKKDQKVKKQLFPGYWDKGIVTDTTSHTVFIHWVGAEQPQEHAQSEFYDIYLDLSHGKEKGK